MISVVVPVCNEAGTVRELYGRLAEVLESSVGLPWEIVFVDDGSSDGTRDLVRDLGQQDERVKGIFLTRSFGQQRAVTAGFDHATGDHLVMMDGDLQHPPEEIPKLLEPYFQGYDVVYGKRASSPNPIRNLASRTINVIANLASDIRIDLDSSTFRVFSRQVKDELCRMPERSRYIVGLIGWLGFSSTMVVIEEGTRKYGETKYSLKDLVELSVDYIMSFSTRPLRLAVYLGLLAGVVSVAISLGHLIQALFFEVQVSGFPTLIVTMTMLGGAILFVLGIVGEYLGKIYMELKRRQMYVVERTVNLGMEEDRQLRFRARLRW